MFVYQQSSGALWAPTGELWGRGYSGRERGKNNHEFEHVKNVGPIPCGIWSINGVYDSPKLGPLVIVLIPFEHEAHGRTFFRIHGDSKKYPGEASKGCIVLKREIREKILAHLDQYPAHKYLIVIE